MKTKKMSQQRQLQAEEQYVGRGNRTCITRHAHSTTQIEKIKRLANNDGDKDRSTRPRQNMHHGQKKVMTIAHKVNYFSHNGGWGQGLEQQERQTQQAEGQKKFGTHGKSSSSKNMRAVRWLDSTA